MKLTRPISGAISGARVELVDLSAAGVRIRHQSPLMVGRSVTLVFPHGNEAVSVDCDVVRSAKQQGAFDSGLYVPDPKSPSGGALRRVVSGLLTRYLDQQRGGRGK